MDLLDVASLTKDYGNGRGLFDFSMQLNAGDIVGLIGVNGAGKTTLLNMLAGCIHADSGKICYEGEEVAMDSPRRKKFGVSVDPNFYEYMTTYENLESILYLNGITDAERINTEIKGVLSTVGLEGVEKKKIKEFSFGMKQRLGFAQALLNAQTVLLLDEPFVGLDIHGRGMVKSLIQEMAEKQKMAVIFSDHNLDEVKSLCNRLIVIRDGVKHYDGDIHIQSAVMLNVDDTDKIDSRYARKLDRHRLVITEENMNEKLHYISSIATILSVEKVINPLEKLLEEGNDEDAYTVRAI